MGIIKELLWGIFSIILFILIIVVVGIGTLIIFFLAQLLLLGDKNYLLFISNKENIIAVFMIVFLAIYGLYKLDAKLSKGKGKIFSIKGNSPMRSFDRSSKYFKIIYSIALISFIYYGITSYSALYEERIKVSSPLSPAGVLYEYKDIESIDVGIKKTFGKSYVPYYIVKFNDNKVVNLLSGSITSSEEGKDIEDTLINLDKELVTKGATKSVDKGNLKKYLEDFDKDYANKIERLFED